YFGRAHQFALPAARWGATSPALSPARAGGGRRPGRTIPPPLFGLPARAAGPRVRGRLPPAEDRPNLGQLFGGQARARRAAVDLPGINPFDLTPNGAFHGKLVPVVVKPASRRKDSQTAGRGLECCCTADSTVRADTAISTRIVACVRAQSCAGKTCSAWCARPPPAGRKDRPFSSGPPWHFTAFSRWHRHSSSPLPWPASSSAKMRRKADS